QLQEKIGSHARQQMVAAQCRLVRKRIGEREPRGWSKCHRYRDRAVQLDDGRTRELDECIVERDDSLPVGVRTRTRACRAGGDGGLKRVGPERLRESFSACEGSETALDEQA